MIDLRFYLSIFWRRFPYFLVVASFISALAVTVAMTLPPVFVSQAKLLVQSAQLPDVLVQSTVQTETQEQLQIIETTIFARETLLDTARRLEIFSDDPEMTADDIVDEMRRKTRFDKQSGRDLATLLTISFEYDDPVKAALVANEFVTMVLEENVESRTSSAAETLQFFQQDVDRLASVLDQRSARILEFKNANAEALPDSLDFRRTRQSGLQERLLLLEREAASLVERRDRVIEFYERTGELAARDEARSESEEELLELKRELERLLVIYSENNPRVTILRKRIENLETVVQAERSTALETAPEATPLDIQIAEYDARLELTGSEIRVIEEELGELETSIAATPANAIELARLERDHDNIQEQYNTAVARLAAADTGEQIEITGKGQRITVIEQATVPRTPEKPKRALIAGGGVFFGLGLGLGVVILLELLNQSVRRPEDLTARLGITTFATLPYIRTKSETVWRRAVIITALIIMLIGVPGLLFAVHTYVMPLDLVLEKVLDRVGLGTVYRALIGST